MHARPDELEAESYEGVEVRTAQWGEMSVTQYTLEPGTDLSPFFEPLPDGLCSASHWGIVLDGELHLRYDDGTRETTRAGEVYHWPASHTAWTDTGVVFLAVTPVSEETAMDEHLAAQNS